MKVRLAWLAFGLASLVCAYGAYVHGTQLIAALTFASHADVAIPLAFWVLTGVYALHTVGVCAGWWIGYLGMTAGRYRQAAIGTAVGLISSTGLLIAVFAALSAG